MYTTQGILKNINLRTEFKGEDERQGAMDLKIEVPLTPEFHEFLCKHTDKTVPIKSFSGAGIAELKYNIELENIVFTINGYKVESAKLNQVVGKLGGKQIAVLRVQSQMHHKGLIDDLNDITGEPHTITIEELQGDLLDDKDQSKELAPKPQAENKEPAKAVKTRTGKKEAPAPKKKSVKKKAAAKPASNTEHDHKSSELHVVGDAGADLTQAQIKAREEEKANLLKRTVVNKDPVEKSELSQALDMVLDFDGVKLGQGDTHELDKIKTRLNAGRALNMTESEQLNELYNRYCA